MMMDALRLMGAGIGVVFVVLALFFVIIKVLMKIFPPKSDQPKKN